MKYVKQDRDYLCYSSDKFGNFIGRIRQYADKWMFIPDTVARIGRIELRQLYNKIYLLEKKK